MFLTKRRKFIFSSLLLTLGFILIQLVGFTNRYEAIFLLSLLTIPLTLWSLEEALHGPIWLVSWILPMFFTAGVGLFYFLLPGSLLTAIPVILIYFVGMYVLFLSENIFAVAAIRTIQLFRSASAVGFLLTLITSFLLYDTIFSFRLHFYQSALLVAVISFFLFLHGTWAVNLEEKISGQLLLYSLLMALGMGEIALILSFWPTAITLGSLFLTSLVYVSLGIVQAKLNDRLFKKTVEEYLTVGLLVLVVLLAYTAWG
ncbi:MAG TPA: hypothetical protein VMW04_00440 [Patescibacteria group bacterium]|nr:hypothetical protein [Patescibacteria group bacterium]